LAMGTGSNDRFVASLANLSPEAVAHMLRTRNSKLYSLAAIADLFGVSKTTIHRLVMKEGESDG